MSDKSQELYNTDKNTWEKVRDGLKDIVSRIEKYFGKLSPDSMLGKQGARLVKQNQEILDRFLAGVRAASENAGYTEKTTGEGGVRYMSRYAKAPPLNEFIGALYDSEWERYSKSTALKVVDMLTSHNRVVQIEELIDRDLPEEEFLAELSKLEE